MYDFMDTRESIAYVLGPPKVDGKLYKWDCTGSC